MTRISRLAAVLCTAAVPALATAQSRTPKPQFGILGAYNLATISGSDVPNKSNLSAYSAGVFGRFYIDSTWSVQPEIEYAVKGVKFRDDTENPPIDGKVELKYVEIPVLLHATTGVSSSLRLYGELGPSFSFKNQCTASASAQGVSVSFSCTDIGTLRSYDIGGAAGAGVEIPTGNQAVLIGVRYTVGFVDISSEGSNKNRNLQFLAGFRF